MTEPTTAELILSLRDWAHGAHELPDDTQLLVDVADRLEAADEGWYLANGVADLAMKHRDIAEEKLEAISELCEKATIFFESLSKMIGDKL